MKRFVAALIFLSIVQISVASDLSFSEGRRGFMIGAPVKKDNQLLRERSTSATPMPPNKNRTTVAFPPAAENKPVIVDVKINETKVVLSQHRSAQNIAIRAGLPTFVSTYYNPTNQIRNVSWGTAATSGIIGSVVGMGAEIYDEWNGDDHLNYVRIAQTGSLLGTATASGVIIGQTVQKSLLTNSYMLWGGSSDAVSSQIISGFTADALGGGVATMVYSSGAYFMGWVDPAEARTAMVKGATGSLLMAAGKSVGTQAFFSATGASGGISVLGPYAITYLAAVGAIYLTDWIFEEIDKQEEGDRIANIINSMQKQ